jgi:hypothetical protein
MAALVIAGLTLIPAGGCWSPGYEPGGPMASRDLFTYVSTGDFPQNVTVLDWTTDEKLLTVEIPIGQQLVIRFFEDYNDKDPNRPALMRWKLMPRGQRFGELNNTMPVPDATRRRVDVDVRERADAVPMPAPEAAQTK